MSNPTYVKLTGWVTKDPELRLTNKDRTPVCTIRMGVAPRWLDRSAGEWKEGEASYFDVVCWRSLASNVSSSVRKGDMVTVHGTFRTRTWTDKDNNPRTQVEITATSVGHEMLYGWSHFNRTQRASSRAEEDLATGEASRGLEQNPFNDGYSGGGYGNDGDHQNAEAAPTVRPAYEPDGGQGREPVGGPAGARVYGTGDEGAADDGSTSGAAADGPRREEVAVPV